MNNNFVHPQVMMIPKMGNRRSSGNVEQADKYEAIGCELIEEGERQHN